MNKSFSAKVLILLLVVVLGGAALLFQKGGQKKALTSDVLAPIIVTPAACYLQPDLDKKIAEKKTLEEVQQKSASEIQTALATIDATILAEEPLVTQKKELDVLSAQKMTTEKPSKIAYMQAEKKVNSMVKPVVPTEPTLVAEPVVPVKPTLAPAPVVPRKPVEPKAPVAPPVPRIGTTAYKTYINVTKPQYDAAKKVYDEQTKPARTMLRKRCMMMLCLRRRSMIRSQNQRTQKPLQNTIPLWLRRENMTLSQNQRMTKLRKSMMML